MRISALFAGVAGLELGLQRAGHETLMFCEVDPGAISVLRSRFPHVPIHHDIRELKSLPTNTEMVTAGFPCQDLSQAGMTQGINGSKTGVVSHLFRLLRQQDIPHVLIENVPFMLQLRKGQAIRVLVNALEEMGYRWAYRTIDARAMGVPQRRQRVFLLASKEHEPWHTLLLSNLKPRKRAYSSGVACGFYWTEGNRGLGWAVDAIPTLKGGSSVGIPSPPAIWMPGGRIVTPQIRDAERFQGFSCDWTKPAEEATRKSHRWKLVGNAVCVRVAEWIGQRVREMADAPPVHPDAREFDERCAWPKAAFGWKGNGRAAVNVSAWPRAEKTPSLATFLRHEPKDLSLKAATGFVSRLTSSTLRYPEAFLLDLISHQGRMAAEK